MKRALITGGSGFVGRRLSTRLLKLGVEVTWLSRQDPGDERLPEGVSWKFGDLSEPTTLRGCVEAGDHVFHLAAVLGAARASGKKYSEVNVRGTEQILDEALKSGAIHFQFLSSFSAMGPVGDPASPMTEETTPQPNSLYGLSKWEAERRIAELAGDDLPCTILRPPIIYGPGANSVSAAARLFDLAAKKNPIIVGSGENTFPVCHVDNLVSAMIHVIRVAKGGVETYLVADDPPNTLKEFLDALRGPRCKTGRYRYFPGGLMRCLAWGMEAIARPLGRSPILSAEVVGGLTRSAMHYDLARLKGTGWEPEVTMADGAASWVG